MVQVERNRVHRKQESWVVRRVAFGLIYNQDKWIYKKKKSPIRIMLTDGKGEKRVQIKDIWTRLVPVILWLRNSIRGVPARANRSPVNYSQDPMIFIVFCMCSHAGFRPALWKYTLCCSGWTQSCRTGT